MLPKIFKLTITDFHDHYGFSEESQEQFFVSLSDVGVKTKIENDYDIKFEGNVAYKYYRCEDSGRKFEIEEIQNVEVV